MVPITRVKASRVFSCNYEDLAEVIALAKHMGPGMSVIRYPGRKNYNITHTDREPRLPRDVKIHYRTI